MKKTKAAVLFACLLAALPARGDTELVARKDFDVNPRWKAQKVMGREFWNLTPYIGPWWHEKKLRDLKDLPMIKESALKYALKSLRSSESSDVVSTAELEKLDIQDNVPVFISTDDSRPPVKCMQNFKTDLPAYEAWKKKHPNVITFYGGCEWDFEYLTFDVYKPTDRVSAMLEKWNLKDKLPRPQNKEEAVDLLRKVFDATKNYYFNDPDRLMYLRGGWCFDHYALEWGADMAVMETTNTGPYRHQVSMFFARGASRQYHKKWAWYIALCYSGYNDKGASSVNNTPYYTCPPDHVYGRDAKGACLYDGWMGHGCGASPSVNMRAMYLGYLNGATYVAHEVWPYAYFQVKDKEGQCELSPHGEAMKEWYEFTTRNPDRGVAYTPVALLVPFEQGYPQWGGKPWSTFKYERADGMIDAFMHTIVPYSPVTPKGGEGCLSNSPYGDIYDVITPNAPGGVVPLEALNSYKVAILLGGYKEDPNLVSRLTDYVRNGGTLVLNIRQANKLFTEEFLGLERKAVPEDARDLCAMEVKGPVRSVSDGKTFVLPEKYEMEPVTMKGASPVLADSDGNTLACVNKFGKGRVITMTVDNMIPQKLMSGAPEVFLKEMENGRSFPFVSFLLERVVSEVLPLEVRGDVEYGLNKLDDGFLLYLVNNKGVVKYTNVPQMFDKSKTASVKVLLRSLKPTETTELRSGKAVTRNEKDNSISVDVPPGDVKVIRIRTK